MDSARVATAIIEARRTGTLLDAPLPDGPVGLDQAYAVQELVFRRRTEAGESVVGWKLGYTSAAMRAQMRIDEPNYAPLTDRMLLRSGDAVPEEGLLQPRVEPEIALVVGTPVSGGARDPDAVVASVAGALVALEVVDSVFRDYRFRIEDNTADGSSAAFAVLGEPLAAPDLADLRVALWRNEAPAGAGFGRDALGGPYDALRWLVAALAATGRALRPGDLVLTGGITQAVPLELGDVVRADFGDATVSVTRLSKPTHP